VDAHGERSKNQVVVPQVRRLKYHPDRNPENKAKRENQGFARSTKHTVAGDPQKRQIFTTTTGHCRTFRQPAGVEFSTERSFRDFHEHLSEISLASRICSAAAVAGVARLRGSTQRWRGSFAY